MFFCHDKHSELNLCSIVSFLREIKSLDSTHCSHSKWWVLNRVSVVSVQYSKGPQILYYILAFKNTLRAIHGSISFTLWGLVDKVILRHWVKKRLKPLVKITHIYVVIALTIHILKMEPNSLRIAQKTCNLNWCKESVERDYKWNTDCWLPSPKPFNKSEKHRINRT